MSPAVSTTAFLSQASLTPLTAQRAPALTHARPAQFVARRARAAVLPAAQVAPVAMGLEGVRHALAIGAAAALLALTPAGCALAARGGGRMGGSSFRAPSAPQRSYSAPRQSVAPGYGGGYGGYGGGYGSGMMMGPSLFYSPMMMVGGGGGGGLGTVVLVGAAGALAYRVLQERQEDAEVGKAVNPDTAVVNVKVGLLASARQLQVDLDGVARSADTGSVKGLRFVLEEAVLSLLRNPDRWVYGSVGVKVGKFTEAEDVFNRVCMEERLKIGEETLSNVSGRSVERQTAAGDGSDVGEFIVVSLVCAAIDEGLSKAIPREINGPADLNRALGMLGGVSTDTLQGVEIIWAPQNLKDTLTEREMLADHPELRLI